MPAASSKTWISLSEKDRLRTMADLPEKRGFSLWRIGIVGLLLLLVIWKMDFHLFFSHFDFLALRNILFVQPLVLLCLVMAAFRFRIILGKPFPLFRLVFKAILLTYGLNNLLPGRVGELLKVSFMKEHAQVSIPTGLAAVFLERMMDVFFLGSLTLIGVEIFWKGMTFQPWVAFSLVAVGVLFLIPRIENLLIRLLRHLPWKLFQGGLEAWVQQVAKGIREHRFFKALPFGLAGWGFSFFLVALFLHLGGVIPLGQWEALAVFIGVTVGSAIPALPGGLGTYEAGAVFVLRQMGFPWEKALYIAVTLHLSQILFCVAGACWVMATERMGLSTLIRRAREVAESKG